MLNDETQIDEIIHQPCNENSIQHLEIVPACNLISNVES